MRLFLATLFLLAACDSDDDGGNEPGPDGRPGEIDGGSVADCQKPLTGRYAYSRGVTTRSQLLRIGDGIDDFDEQLGVFVLDGGEPPVTQILLIGDVHYALVAQFVMTFDPQPIVNMEVPLTQVAELSGGDFDVAGPAAAPYFLGVRDNLLYCVDPRDGSEHALGDTGVTCPIVALHGTCDFVDNGAYDVGLIATCDDSAVRYQFTREAGGEPVKVLESPPVVGLRDIVAFPTPTLAVAERGELYDVSEAGLTLRRVTKLCVDPGNPFNGSRLGMNGME